MNLHSLSCIGAIALLLYSCNTPTFDQPQPAGAKPLAKFPARLQGRYWCVHGASNLIISDQLVTRHYDHEVKEHKDSLAFAYLLVGDTLISRTDSTKEKVTIMGDSVLRHYNWIDTLFTATAGDVLTKFKGHYFLNRRFGDVAWGVSKMSMQQGVLLLGSLSDQEDIKKLNDITGSANDTLPMHFSLTGRQFKMLVRKGGFSNEEAFVRMRIGDN